MFGACYAVSVLIVSLSLGNSAPTTPDCEATITPLALDPAKMSGRWSFIEGFLQDSASIMITKTTTNSAWLELTVPPEDNSTLTMMWYNHINGACSVERSQISLISDNNMDVPHHTNNTGDVNRGTSLPTCSNCLVLNFATTVSGKSDVVRTLQLLVRPEHRLEESDLRAFHHQAKCLNFSLPADHTTGWPTESHDIEEQEFCDKDNKTVTMKKQQIFFH